MDETVPAAENAGMDPCQNFRVARDPIVVAAAHHCGSQAETLRLGEVLLDAGPELLECGELDRKSVV